MVTILIFLLFGLVVILGIQWAERHLIDDDME